MSDPIRQSARPPVIPSTTAPGDALREALDWLATVVPGVTLVRSRNLLRHERGPVRMEIPFNTSTWSRTGIGAWCRFTPVVVDAELGRWRRRTTGRTGDLAGRLMSWGTYPGGDVQLYGPPDGPPDGGEASVRSRSLAEVPRILIDDVLPRLERFDSPARLAAEADPFGPRGPNDVLEWAVFRGDREAARRLVRRWIELHPGARERIEHDRQPGAELVVTTGSVSDLVGPVITRLGIFAPDEPLD